MALVLFLSCLALSNALRYYSPENNQWFQLFIYIASATVLSLLIAFVTYKQFFQINLRLGEFSRAQLPVFALALTCSALFTQLKRMRVDQQAWNNKRAEIEKIQRDTELSGLRQQLQPHFLFNALNSIYSLVKSQPDQAREMTLKLAQFYRGSLVQPDGQQLFKEEIKHLLLYLEIEQIRFGERLQLRIDIPSETDNLMVPALILQPLIENAIKHGLNESLGPFCIDIQASAKSGLLSIGITNPLEKHHQRPNPGAGIGLQLVNRRLQLLYGRSDLLQIKQEANLFSAQVKIPVI